MGEPGNELGNVYELSIDNLFCVEKARIPLTPGVHGFVGKNEQGKTTILNALAELINGGNDAAKIRAGAKRAEVTLDVIRGNETVASVSRKQTEKNNTLSGKGLPIGETPANFLRQIADEVMVNPVKLVTDDPVSYLRKHLPAPLGAEDLPADFDAGLLPMDYEKEPNGFAVSAAVAKAIEEQRRQAGADMRHLETLVKEQRATLPTDKPADVPDAEELQDRRAGLSQRIGEAQARAQNKAALEEKADQLGEQCSAIQERIKELESQLEAERQRLGEATERWNDAVAERDAYHVADLRELEQELADVDAKIDSSKDAARIQEAFGRLEENEVKLTNAKARHARLDSQFKWFAYELPTKLLERCDLQVPGLEFRDDKLLVDGIPLANHSESRRALICVRLCIALAKARGQKAICFDGAEVMDEVHLGEFFKAAKEAEAQGMAVLYTRVGDPKYPHEREVVAGRVA